MAKRSETPPRDDPGTIVQNHSSFTDRWGKAGIVATVVIALVAVVTVVLAFADRSPQTVATPSESPTPAIPSESFSTSMTVVPDMGPRQTIASTDMSPKVGCWNENSPVPCEAKHSEETGEIVPCDLEGLTAFMGGVVTYDLLRDTISVEVTENGCAVRGIESRTRRSMSNILNDSAGDVYRRCREEVTNIEIGCDLPHLFEQIYEGGSESFDCEQKFAEYVGKEFSSFATKLQIVPDPGSPSACWVKTRVANQLNGSLRNLRDRPLPFEDT